MPVTFYPNKNIERLEELIKDQNGKTLNGEIKIYRELHKSLGNSKKEYHVWHDMQLPSHVDGYFDGVNSNPKKKTASQIDFIVLCDEGIIVIEVKGGQISYCNNQFYYGSDCTGKKCDDPYSQANGYKHTLRQNILKEFKGFYSSAVAFPNIKISFTTRIHNEQQLWSDYTSKKYHEYSIEKFILNWIQKEKTLHNKKGRNFSGFSNKQIDQIINVLSPNKRDENPLHSVEDTYKWLEVQNLEILEGLQKNDRIMIEGPPGSGKTTYALAFADRFKRKKGLYLCWNTLLSYSIDVRIKNRKLSRNLEVFTFQKFIQDRGGFNFDDFKSLTDIEYFEKTKSTIEKIKAENNFTNYDYIIIDEAQDYAEKGLDLVLDQLCGDNSSGLKDGNILILYDIDQSYSLNGRDVKDDIDYLAEFFAHYKLNETKRSLQKTGIKKLSQDVLDGSMLSSNSESITIEKFSSFREAKKKFQKKYLHNIRNTNSSLLGKDCIVLGESRFYNEENEIYFPIEFLVADMEELNKDNVCNTKNILRHTSILKYKGLEAKNVFLFTTKLNSYNQYELYIGITRAMNHLHIFIINE